MSTRDEDLLDDNFQLLLEESFTLNSSSIPASRPSEPPLLATPLDPTPADLAAPALSPFAAGLARFYSVYKPENVVRSAQIAAKFDSERQKLWEQLSVKYVLSYRASCKLFMDICDHPGTLTGLFEEQTEAASSAAAGWTASVTEDKQQFYWTMRQELTERQAAEESIERDVNRTHQEIGWFHEAGTKRALVNMLQLTTVLNGMEYVQGMHEIAGIVYFEVREEAKAFWVLNEVLMELKDLFNAEVDEDKEIGIYGMIEEIENIVKYHANPKLYRHLEKLGFPSSTVILRYLTTLLATELTIPDTVRIWQFAFRALGSHSLRDMAKALVVGYLLMMADTLMECEDLEGLMPAAANFGRSVAFNPDVLLRNVAACYAFERKLAGKYVLPQSPGVIAVLGDAVEGVLNKVGALLEQLNDANDSAVTTNATSN